jgi:anti-sigma regulatory factor (Ser/Thr protein kinase)
VKPGDKIVVAHPDRKAQRTLQRLVGATLCPVEVVGDVDALLAAIDPSAIVVVDAGLAQSRADLRSHAARAWIAEPGEGVTPADPSSMAALLAAGWDHVVSHAMPLLAEELIATVQKLIRNDLFGLEKYMAWGAEVRSYALDDARDRDAAVAKLAADVVAVGLPDRFGSLVSVIADELIANAIYAAPVDEQGTRTRAQESRDTSRALTGRDAVTVRWATDARYLAIEVRDNWGSLDVPAVTKKLAAGGTQVSSDGEGGMGLPLAYACANQLVIDCEPNARTEVIALIDVRYKPTELARTASFHAFVQAC